MDISKLKFQNIIKVNSQTARLTMNKERVAMFSVEAFGKLRKDLISTLGVENAKALLLRYGWFCGVKTAESILSEKSQKSLEDLLLFGPYLHTIQGFVKAEANNLIFNQSSLYFSGYWKNSFEAEEHLNHYGPVNENVCWMLEGFASGYLTKVFGKDVLASEDKCVAKGDRYCSFIAQTKEEWGQNVLDYYRYYELKSLKGEFDQSYRELEKMNQNIIEANQIQVKLVNLLFKDKKLEDIIGFAAKVLKRSMIFENTDGIVKKFFLSEDHKKIYYYFKNKYYSLEKSKKSILTYNVKTDDICFGRLIILGSEKAGIRAKLIISKVLEILSIKLFYKWKLTRTMWKNKEHFFSDMLEGKGITNYEEVFHLFNFNPYKTNRIVTLKVYPEKKQDKILEYLITVYSEKDIFLKESYIVIIDEEESITREFCLKLIKTLHGKFKPVIIHLGVGRKAKNISDLISSYQDSYKINDFLHLTHPDNSHVAFFEELEPLMLLLKGTEQKDLIDFYLRTIGRLVKHDYKYGTNFLNTLKVYLDNNGNLQQTSHDLYLSISGVRYRIERIENFCKIDLNTGDGRFKCQLAIQIHLAFQINKSNIGHSEPLNM